jgi:hypothetical protein
MDNCNLQQGGGNGEDNILLLLFIIGWIILYNVIN